MKCPFCQNSLNMSNSDVFTTYYCNEVGCLINGEMPKYIVSYQNNSSIPISKTFYLDNNQMYVQVDFINNVTVINKLDVIMLVNRVIIPRALDLNLNDLPSVYKKLQTLVMFS